MIDFALAFLNVRSYNIVTNKRSEGSTMQIQKRSLINRGTALWSSLFETPQQAQPAEPRVLPVQPLFQRRQFLARAIEEHREVFVQLMPVHTDGQITNVRGHLSQLRVGQYVIQTGNLSYFFELPQLRYIAG